MKTILAVDDDKWILEVMRDALSLRGFEVLTAELGTQALRLLQENPVDLVLLDLNMPGQERVCPTSGKCIPRSRSRPCL